DEACTDGCGADIDCRVWTHDGEESTQAPVGLIIDAVRREIYEPHAGTEVQAYKLPDNLRRFFANRAKASRAAARNEIEGRPPTGSAGGMLRAGRAAGPLRAFRKR